jgi:NADPH:quinone reductase-like Zn-dependent oxidoreductase
VHSLGADHVIDYKKEDITKNGQQFDLILAVNGYHPISDYLYALKTEGILVIVGGSMLQLVKAAIFNKRGTQKGDQKIFIASLEQNKKDLILIKELLETGDIQPVIDACYSINETSKAFWYFETAHPKGKVVISVVG